MVVGRTILRDTKSRGFLGCIYVCTQEDEFPAVLLLLSLYHSLHAPVVEDDTGILHAVRRDHEQRLRRPVFFSRVLVDVSYVVDRSSDRVQ
jgi:hypothetical protein